MNATVSQPSSLKTTLASGFVVSLEHTGIMGATGDDANHFIHGQFSNDIEHLGQNSVRVATYCTPQGRMLALFYVWKSAGSIFMTVSSDILPSLKKRLQMYILRAKVTLTDESNAFSLIGLGGTGAANALSDWFDSLPENVYDKREADGLTLMRIRDAFGAPRYILGVPASKASELMTALSQKLSTVSENEWLLTDNDAGMPVITAAVADRFIPQMVNLEEVEGLSFKKGCYPGQEVIARSQYRGTVKRKMFHVRANLPEDKGSESTIVAGAELFDATGACGTIVQAAHIGNREFDCLAVLTIESSASADIHAVSVDGPLVSLVELPYLHNKMDE